MQRTRPITSALACLVPVLALTAPAAQAAPPRSASVAVTRTGPAGNSTTRQSSIGTNGHGGYSANSTITGPKGNTATRQQSGSYDPASKTYTRSGTTTGPNGKSSSFNTQLQGTGNGYARSATRTGPNGNSVTREQTVTGSGTASH